MSQGKLVAARTITILEGSSFSRAPPTPGFKMITKQKIEVEKGIDALCMFISKGAKYQKKNIFVQVLTLFTIRNPFYSFTFLLYSSIPLTIHLNQKFWFNPATGFVFIGCSSPATDGINLIYEDGCWCIKPGLRNKCSLGRVCFCHKKLFRSRSLVLTFLHYRLYKCSPIYHFKQQTNKFFRLAPVFGGEGGGGHIEESSPTFCGHSFG